MERFKVKIPIWSFKERKYVDRVFIWDTGASKCFMPEKTLKEISGVSLPEAFKVLAVKPLTPTCIFMRTLAGYSVCIGHIPLFIKFKVYNMQKNQHEDCEVYPLWCFIPDTTDCESTFWSLRIARECIERIAKRIKDKLEYERIKEKMPTDFFKKYVVAYGIADSEVKKEKIVAELVTDWNEANYIIKNEYKCDGILSVSQILRILEKDMGYVNIEFDETKNRFIAERKEQGITML